MHYGSIDGVVGSFIVPLMLGFDGQHILIAIVGIFALSVIESPGPIVKTLLATLIITGLVIPVTRQFLLPVLPVITWAVLFYSCRLETRHFSASITSTREHIIWSESFQCPLKTHFGATRRPCMVALRNHPFRSTSCLLRHIIPLRTTWNAPRVCSKFRIYEYNGRYHTTPLSDITTMYVLFCTD
jgi:hypothetical protein